ncbi:MAG: hypothetical protein JXP72_10050, partial [Coriobacteriia bacterium]|nr:hypothetical protein [Coriobacteriia bacterium]
MHRLPLRGTPFPFGLSFVPTDTLGPVIGALHGPIPDLLEACGVLGASFAFVPADVEWSASAAAALAEADVAPMWAVSGPLWPVIEARGALEGLRETLTRPEEVGAEIDAL